MSTPPARVVMLGFDAMDPVLVQRMAFLSHGMGPHPDGAHCFPSCCTASMRPTAGHRIARRKLPAPRDYDTDEERRARDFL